MEGTPKKFKIIKEIYHASIPHHESSEGLKVSTVWLHHLIKLAEILEDNYNCLVALRQSAGMKDKTYWASLKTESIWACDHVNNPLRNLVSNFIARRR